MPSRSPFGIWLAVFAILIAVCSTQIGAAFGKRIFPITGPIGAVSLRLMFACLILVTIFRPWHILAGPVRWRPLILYGIALGGMNLMFYLAINRIPLGVGVALEFMGPLTVAVANSRRPRDWLYVALAVTGVAILLPLHRNAAPLDGLGVAFALMGGACWAAYIIFGQKVSLTISSGAATALGISIACALIVPLGVIEVGATMFSPAVLPVSLVVAVLSSALPYTLEMVAMKRLPARTFSILMSTEPASAAVSGLLILGERLTLSQWLAIGCIMAASIGSSLSARDRR